MPDQPPTTQRHFLRRIPRGCRIGGCLILALPCALVSLFLLFISLLSPLALPANAAPLPSDFQKGITFESWWKEQFSSANADQVLADIIQPIGADWIALIVKCQ